MNQEFERRQLRIRIIYFFIPDGGECAVMDSGMGWSWNAVRCVISGELILYQFIKEVYIDGASGHVSCQGPPVWCPSPPISEGARVDQPDQERHHQGAEVSVACQRGLTGHPGQSVTTR